MSHVTQNTAHIMYIETIGHAIKHKWIKSHITLYLTSLKYMSPHIPNESCDATWRSKGTQHDWVRHTIWMSLVKQHGGVKSHNTNESCLWMGHVTQHEWVMSHNMNESCHTIWMSHVTQYEWVMSHNMNESYHTTWRSQVTQHEWVMSHKIHVTSYNVQWHVKSYEVHLRITSKYMSRHVEEKNVMSKSDERKNTPRI